MYWAGRQAGRGNVRQSCICRFVCHGCMYVCVYVRTYVCNFPMCAASQIDGGCIHKKVFQVLTASQRVHTERISMSNIQTDRETETDTRSLHLRLRERHVTSRRLGVHVCPVVIMRVSRDVLRRQVSKTGQTDPIYYTKNRKYIGTGT